MQERPKQGHHYECMAANAKAAGFRAVNRHVVQLWVRHGLLPRLAYTRPAFGVRVPQNAEAIEDQLLGLCRLRYDQHIRSHAELALALWVTGWKIEDDVVQEAFRRYLAPIARLVDETTRGNFACRAARSRRQAARRRSPEGVELALAYDSLFAVISGATAAKSDHIDDLAALERVMGLDRARTDRIGDASPWLPSPPGHGLAQGAEGMAVPRLIDAVERATPLELETARTTATALHRRLSVLVPAMQLGFGRDFAGFGVLHGLAEDPRFRIILCLAVLMLPAQAALLLNGLPGEADLVEIENAALQAQRLVAADPALAERVAAMGFVAGVRAEVVRDDQVAL